MATVADVLKDALILDVQDRAYLAERLLISLDDDSTEEIGEAEASRLWALEAQRRLESYRAGDAQPIPADEVHARLQKIFR